VKERHTAAVALARAAQKGADAYRREKLKDDKFQAAAQHKALAKAARELLATAKRLEKVRARERERGAGGLTREVETPFKQPRIRPRNAITVGINAVLGYTVLWLGVILFASPSRFRKDVSLRGVVQRLSFCADEGADGGGGGAGGGGGDQEGDAWGREAWGGGSTGGRGRTSSSHRGVAAPVTSSNMMPQSHTSVHVCVALPALILQCMGSYENPFQRSPVQEASGLEATSRAHSDTSFAVWTRQWVSPPLSLRPIQVQTPQIIMSSLCASSLAPTMASQRYAHSPHEPQCTPPHSPTGHSRGSGRRRGEMPYG
jgi:hypothetical protein